MRLPVLTGVSRRLKLLAAVVFLAPIVSGLAVLLLVPPVYQASSSYVLQRAPATSVNPFLPSPDPSAVVTAVAGRLDAPPVRERVAGADERYQVRTSTPSGQAGPVIDVSVEAGSSKAALSMLRRADEAVTAELLAAQVEQKIDPQNMITVRPVQSLVATTRDDSARLWWLLGVFSIGAAAVAAIFLTTPREEKPRLQWFDPWDEPSPKSDPGSPPLRGVRPGLVELVEQKYVPTPAVPPRLPPPVATPAPAPETPPGLQLRGLPSRRPDRAPVRHPADVPDRE
jgi:hypothetical protein